MTDKERIEEMVGDIAKGLSGVLLCEVINLAKTLVDLGYRKNTEGSVVLSKEEAGEIKQIKKEIAEQAIESEKLKKNIAEAVNSFIRLETLYKIKCKELELAEEKSRKETAREILKTLKEEIDEGYIPATIKIKELAKQFGVEIKE